VEDSGGKRVMGADVRSEEFQQWIGLIGIQ